MNQFYLAQNIYFLRRHFNLTQSQIAENIGTTKQTIYNYEKGLREPTIENLVRISNFFKIDMKTLVLSDLSNNTTTNEHTIDLLNKELTIMKNFNDTISIKIEYIKKYIDLINRELIDLKELTSAMPDKINSIENTIKLIENKK